MWPYSCDPRSGNEVAPFRDVRPDHNVLFISPKQHTAIQYRQFTDIKERENYIQVVPTHNT